MSSWSDEHMVLLEQLWPMAKEDGRPAYSVKAIARLVEKHPSSVAHMAAQLGLPARANGSGAGLRPRPPIKYLQIRLPESTYHAMQAKRKAAGIGLSRYVDRVVRADLGIV